MKNTCLIFLFVVFNTIAAIANDIPIGRLEAGAKGTWRIENGGFAYIAEQRRAQAPYANATGPAVWSGARGVESKGAIVSPAFEIAKPYVNFLVLGARDFAAALGAELLIDDRVVRSASATEERGETQFRWRTWDVREFAGKKAVMRFNDKSDGGWIAAADVSQSDEPRATPTDSSELWRETFRPQFHFTQPRGWLSDPNGLLYYKGIWHMFHQHQYPGSKRVVWAHATSTDLVHWRHKAVALPAGTGDSNFSGTGLVDWGNISGLKDGEDAPILLFYTLHPEKPVRKTVQHLAYSTDGGNTWKNYSGNPILRTEDYRDRDPGVFWHRPSRGAIMVLSLSKNNKNRPGAEYGIYRSSDFKSWELIQKLGPDAWYWECPDMFELPLDGNLTKSKWILMKGSSDYIIGSFDGYNFKPETDKIKLRWGGHYYATQTFSGAPGGRRVQLGWMNTDKPKWPTGYPGMPFNQQMSCPRDLTLHSTAEGPRIFRYPVPELEQLRVRNTELPAGELGPGRNALEGNWPELLDLEFECEVRSAKRIVFDIRGEQIIYLPREKTLHAFNAKAPLAPVDGRIKLRILIDRTSIEIFGNGGAADISGVFFASSDQRSLSLTAEEGVADITRLTVHEMKSIWEK